VPRSWPDALAGRHNVLKPFGSAQPDFAQLTDGLGERFDICDTSLKRHACCSQTHAAIDALLILQAEHGFDWPQIERIQVQLAHDALSMIDNNSLWTHNIQYVMAVAARAGRIGREHFAESWTSNPDLAALAARVDLWGSDELQSRFPGLQGAIVRVETRDGGDYTLQKQAPVGTPSEPMSQAELQDKFFALAGTALDADRVKALWELLSRFEDLADTGEFFRLLIPA
jgi:2-methylcitrate dehydratase PrpD